MSIQQITLRPLADVLVWAKENNGACRFLDGRDVSRLLAFLPDEEWGAHGFGLKEGAEKPKVMAWNLANVVTQFAHDLEFAHEKCEDERGISAELMAEVVQMWCYAVGDDKVPNMEYGDYGRWILEAADAVLVKAQEEA